MDSVEELLQHLDDSTTGPSPATSLRLPPLLSLSSPLTAAVVDSPHTKHSAVVCVLSLLRALLRVDRCVRVGTGRTQVGRMVNTRAAGGRRGKGWVGGRYEGDSSSEDSDAEAVLG